MIDPEALEACLSTLAEVARLAPDDPRYERVERAVASLTKTAKQKRRAERRQRARSEDRETIEAARSLATAEHVLHHARRCAVCKELYRLVDVRYAHHCPSCSALDRAKGEQRVDLRGRSALVTGGRIKIGHELALRLLRDGAHVTITTRFPHDAKTRFAEAPDAASWIERLSIEPLHLGDVKSILAFTARLRDRGVPIDIVVNNAAQTVRRPPAYYAEWSRAEVRALPGSELALPNSSLRSFYDASLSLQVGHGDAALFPLGARDEEALPLDLRPRNSWKLEADEVFIGELAEVLVINTIAPFLLTTELRALMRRSTAADRYVVHATAVEGQFVVRSKTSRHPHTNMAKAALNMFTRTSASDFARDGIYMTSVDTGWVTNENPEPDRARQRERGFRAPLDVHDAAARLYDPIVQGALGNRLFGVLLKDYVPVPW